MARSNPFKSSIGLKLIMAVTGLFLFGFTIVHMLGNLQVFEAPDAINHYAHVLQSNPALVWTFRILLLLAVLLHIDAAVRLTRRNRASRPTPYAQINANGATLASRTMFVGGLVIAVFIVFHILHFTVMAGPFHEYSTYQTSIPGDPDPVHDVHRMIVTAFQNLWVSAFYIVAVAFLGLHLKHGGAALFRTLGIGNQITFGWQNWVARLFALAVFLGMEAVPIGVLLGIVK